MNIIISAAAIFIFTYALISIRTLPKVNINRGLAAGLGGLLMIAFGVVAPVNVPNLINFDVILLLLGMMLLVAGLEFSGFFNIISDILVQHSKDKVRLLAYIMMICASLSAIALNDAVVLIFTPIVIKCCRRTNSNPIPYLIGVMFSANIGSLATAVGNPHNAYITSVSGMSFLEFSAHTLPMSLLCLPIAFFVIYLFFRKNLSQDHESIKDTERTEIDKSRLGIIILIMLGALTGFALSSFLGIQTYVVAMVAGVLALGVVMTRSPKNIVWVAKKINWSIIIFFIGLFILIGGVAESGLLTHIAALFPGFGPGESPSILGVTIFSTVLSNLVSNVPAVVLIGNMLPPDNTLLWIALAASSTLAGNTTIIGSAANVIVSERSESAGVCLNFWKFALIGIPVTLFTLFLSIGFLLLIS